MIAAAVLSLSLLAGGNGALGAQVFFPEMAAAIKADEKLATLQTNIDTAKTALADATAKLKADGG